MARAPGLRQQWLRTGKLQQSGRQKPSLRGLAAVVVGAATAAGVLVAAVAVVPEGSPHQTLA